MQIKNKKIIGRFAPTPSGFLHFGSLVASLASFLDAKTQGGLWFLRIDDVDLPRARADSVLNILQTLEAFGFEWDGDVVYQSRHLGIYQEFLEKLRPFLFECNCTRQSLKNQRKTSDGGIFYPGICQNRNIAGDLKDKTIRFTVPDNILTFNDFLLGTCAQNLADDCGDFVIKRRDNVFAYHLATVVDDYLSGISHVVRGSDLKDSTFRQILLQQVLGFETPFYAHVPIVKNAKGEKLSKQTQATPLNHKNPSKDLWDALKFLKQNPPVEIKSASTVEIWDWAKKNWSLSALIAQMPTFGNQANGNGA